jgi:predicted kinase
VPWDQLLGQFPRLQSLRHCPQDAEFHAEGDVLTHTRRVCEALVAMPAWRALPAGDRDGVFAAALFHDLGKPELTRQGSDGRLSARGHARLGAGITRELLWELAPLIVRERVVALVRHHGLPLHLLERSDPLRDALGASLLAPNSQLLLVGAADVQGRECADPRDLDDRLVLFREFCREHQCLDGPYPFPSAHARFQYFRTPGRAPAYSAHDGTRFTVVLMAGLPGAGKDTWLRRHAPELPVVSLDGIRRELRIPPGADQAPVVKRARALAREQLRAGRSFAWNATNVTRLIRDPLIELFAGYGARVRIVYVEGGWDPLLRRNSRRPAPVPEAVIRSLARRLEIPDLTEAHSVDWFSTDHSES